MAKVFRIHRGAANTINNWGDSAKIGTNAIDSIQDPVGATDKKEITSIPSPFARMDLVKRAFKYVVEHGLDGTTAYHKLVSDSLDVGQIFFNIEKYRKFINIIVWDKKNHLEELKNSYLDEHKRLGRTYSTYIQQDCDEYNFDQMDCVYLLNYIDPTGPDMMNIIGATSPATLFFTSANDLSYVKRRIKFGTDSPFDEGYMPLYKREFEYIKYWYSLKVSRTDFPKLFPEVNLYLEKNFKLLTESQKNDIMANVNGASFYTSNYDDIPVTSEAQQYVMILNEKLRRRRSVTFIDSEFEMVISSNLKKPGVNVPLALPIDTYTENTRYVIEKWDKNTHVPYVDNTPINERILPDDGSLYPYVTISDFLEDKIVKIPYKFNSMGYFAGNDNKTDARDSYLLPLKKAYFDYFDVKTLQSNVAGKKMIEIQRMAGDTGVRVILRVPIKAGGYIQYDRMYYKGANPDVSCNKGAIIEGKEFTIGQYPAVKYPLGVKPYYRVAILDRDSVAGDNNPYSLTFYNRQNIVVSPEGIVKRNSNSSGVRIDPYRIDTITYALDSDYDYIHVSGNGVSAIIVPLFTEGAGGKKFRFAIDFGTTNTHIEYTVDDNAVKDSNAFDITDTDMQIQKLHITDDIELRSVFNSDFLPETIGGDSIYRYPMRSVIAESQNTNWTTAVYSNANTNIPFTYEKVMPLSYNVVHTDLKWSANSDDKKRAHKYIESLLVMLRNKVLLNNGDLSKTEIVWFYPASMTQGRFNKFKAEWDEAFKELFNAPERNIMAMSESVAPYYFNKLTAGAVSTVVSVDIGGGTTDVLIVDKGKPELLTSFRFAANTVFGDGYSYNSDSNGIVRTYVPIILKYLEVNKFNSLKEVLNSLDNKKVSTDIIAFLFSLASNKEVLKEKVEIDFSKMLADDNRGKYVIILFFVAIMYHIATIMKAKGFGMPRHITFSGNGSKVLNILSTNKNTLERFSKLIFEKVYKKPYHENGLAIIRSGKEATCKGGILAYSSQSQDYSDIKKMKTILLGTDDSTFVQQGMDYDSLTYSIKNQVVANCKSFIDFAFDLDKEFSYYDEFEIDKSIMDDVRKLCMLDIKTYLENGIELKKESIRLDGADTVVEETLFFYPLIGVLNALAREIYNL